MVFEVVLGVQCSVHETISAVAGRLIADMTAVTTPNNTGLKFSRRAERQSQQKNRREHTFVSQTLVPWGSVLWRKGPRRRKPPNALGD
jgi:hypothetical protein